MPTFCPDLAMLAIGYSVLYNAVRLGRCVPNRSEQGPSPIEAVPDRKEIKHAKDNSKT
jgi:hypothetical protein